MRPRTDRLRKLVETPAPDGVTFNYAVGNTERDWSRVGCLVSFACWAFPRQWEWGEVVTDLGYRTETVSNEFVDAVLTVPYHVFGIRPVLRRDSLGTHADIQKFFGLDWHQYNRLFTPVQLPRTASCKQVKAHVLRFCERIESKA